MKKHKQGTMRLGCLFELDRAVSRRGIELRPNPSQIHVSLFHSPVTPSASSFSLYSYSMVSNTHPSHSDTKGKRGFVPDYAILVVMWKNKSPLEGKPRALHGVCGSCCTTWRSYWCQTVEIWGFISIREAVIFHLCNRGLENCGHVKMAEQAGSFPFNLLHFLQ